MNTYKAFYRKNQIEVNADTSYSAQCKAAAIFNARKTWEVSVIIVAKGETSIIHNPSVLG